MVLLNLTLTNLCSLCAKSILRFAQYLDLNQSIVEYNIIEYRKPKLLCDHFVLRVSNQ